MIQRESWYLEALEKDLLRNREVLRTDPADLQHHLVQEALQSWRAGRTSELERVLLEDPEAPGLFDLLLGTARGAGHLPYMTQPEVFFNSRGISEDQRQNIFDEAFFRGKEESVIREWLFSLMVKGMEFDKEDSEILAAWAIQYAKEEPQLLTSLIVEGTPYEDTVLGSVSESTVDKLYEAALKVTEATKNPHLLSWLWEPEAYEYHSPDGKPPDLSWEAVFATPDNDLPVFSYSEVYYRLEDNYWEAEELNSGTVSLADFARLLSDWSSYSWNQPGHGERGRLETRETEYPEELKDDDLDISYPELEQSAFYVGNETMEEWLRDHWPPPVQEGA